MRVTINTDASFYAGFKAAGYAFWITSDTERLKKAGVLRGPINSSNEAEFKCIINALHAVGKRNYKNLERIYINTDSLITINLVVKDYQNSKWGNELLATYKKLLKDLNITCPIEFRHVKGHKHTKTKRNWVNQWCDDNAKFAIKKHLFGDAQK